jgi:hypothetical protein
VTAAAAESSGDTSIGIGTGEGDYIHKWDVLLNLETSEAVLVTAEPTTDTLTVTRGFGSTTVTAMGSADKLFIIANAAEEGSRSITARSTVKDNKYNYCEIFKESINVTNTSEATTLYGGNDRAYLKTKHAVKLQRLIERAFWWGVRDQDTTSGNNVIRSTGGILGNPADTSYGIQTNVTSNTGVFYESDMETALESLMRYGPRTKFMFCGPRALGVIRSFVTGVSGTAGGAGVINMLPKDKTYGLSIMRYLSPQGELNLVPHAMLYDMADSNADSGTWGDPAQLGVVLDMEQVFYKYLRPISFYTNRQETDRDAKKDEYIGEVGVALKQEKHHGYIKGINYG